VDATGLGYIRQFSLCSNYLRLSYTPRETTANAQVDHFYRADSSPSSKAVLMHSSISASPGSLTPSDAVSIFSGTADATELQPISRREEANQPGNELSNDARDIADADDDCSTTSSEYPTEQLLQNSGTGGVTAIQEAVKRFWKTNITVIVPGEKARDHLALERTYLSYHRTSLQLGMLSVAVSQLQIIQHSPTPSTTFGYYILGKPLAACLASLAIMTSLIGGLRWWRWQRTMLRGKAVSGGWEMAVAGLFGTALVVVIFSLGVAVDIKKHYYE